MDGNAFNGILRAILPAGLAYLVGKGYLGAGAVADVSAAVFAIVSAVWSVISNKPTAPAPAAAK